MYYQQHPPRQIAQPGFAGNLVPGSAQIAHRQSAAVPRSNVLSYTPVGGGGSVMAHSASQSSMQAMPQPAATPSGGGLPMAVPSGGSQASALPSGGGAPRSPQLHIRASMCSPAAPPVSKEALVARAVATPLRTEEATEWSAQCSRRLCSEGGETRFLGKVRFLEKHAAASIQQAVDGLNRRLLWCQEDCCVVFGSADRSYYLLYRSCKREAAFAQLGLAPDADVCAVPVVGHDRGPARGSIAAVMGARVRHESRGSAAVPAAGGNGHAAGGASANSSAAPPAPVASGGKLGKPPLGIPVARTTSARGAAQSYAPAAQVATVEDAAGAASAYQRYASPGARVVQSFQPAPPAWAGAGRLSSGAATPTCPTVPPPMMAVPSGGQRAMAAPPPAQHHHHPPHHQLVQHQQQHQQQQQQPLQPQAQRVGQTGSAVAAPVEPQGYGGHAAPSQQLHTPRETVERGLTEPEKVRFEDLELVESLGSGEFGQVFRGAYQGHEVAIKQLYWDDTMSELVMQDLAREIESFRYLRHKRLVRFIGACLELPHPCLVTEYCPGGSLHHLLHVRKLQLPLLHALNMCLQIADGVMYLHSHTPTIVHRDLKSLNVVLDLSLNVKICDFGLTEPMERTHITKKNNGGSPRYMAPELFDSKTKITEKIDVWAMGCIFVEICGGPLPYEDITTLADLTREMLVHKRTPDVPSYIPQEARKIICTCLSFDYRQRPTSKATFELLKVAKKQLRDAGMLQ